MALTGAMSAGISGLKAHMDALNVVGNNVANVNTQGYKPGRPARVWASAPSTWI